MHRGFVASGGDSESRCTIQPCPCRCWVRSFFQQSPPRSTDSSVSRGRCDGYRHRPRGELCSTPAAASTLRADGAASSLGATHQASPYPMGTEQARFGAAAGHQASGPAESGTHHSASVTRPVSQGGTHRGHGSRTSPSGLLVILPTFEAGTRAESNGRVSPTVCFYSLARRGGCRSKTWSSGRSGPCAERTRRG